MCRFFFRRRGLVVVVVAFFLGFSCWFLVGLVGIVGVLFVNSIVCLFLFLCLFFVFEYFFGWDCLPRFFCGGFSGLIVFTVLFGEFDPGSGRTLAACLTHASRTLKAQLAGLDEWRTGE